MRAGENIASRDVGNSNLEVEKCYSYHRVCMYHTKPPGNAPQKEEGWKQVYVQKSPFFLLPGKTENAQEMPLMQTQCQNPPT
jgi:hypothetical protein